MTFARTLSASLIAVNAHCLVRCLPRTHWYKARHVARHAIEKKLVGPACEDVVAKYAEKACVAAKLFAKFH